MFKNCIVLVCALVLASAAIPYFEEVFANPAEPCTPENCSIDKNCRCSSTFSPLANGTAPQLIILSFDEAVVSDNYNNYWIPLLENRTNPDNKQISATFYVPHEYTDYECVSNLYKKGFEIAVHSISKNSSELYWRNADEATLIAEFGGQKTLMAHFASIKAADIQGVRTPQLKIDGNVSYSAYSKSNLSYDNSWPTYTTSRMFPYTLDFESLQPCPVGNCPNEAFPGFWVFPIVNILGKDDKECNVLLGCEIEGTADEIANKLMEEVKKVKDDNRAPLTFLINSSWFLFTEHSLEGLKKFLDNVKNDKEIFLVSHSQALDWVKKPVALDKYETPTKNRTSTCKPVVCKLTNAEGNDRYMKSCVKCPKNYPWVGNPLGE